MLGSSSHNFKDMLTDEDIAELQRLIPEWVDDKVVSKNGQARLKSHDAIKIGHKAIKEHYKINIEEFDLSSYDEGDYYFITIKVPENSLGGGVSVKVDAYSGKVLEVFFAE